MISVMAFRWSRVYDLSLWFKTLFFSAAKKSSNSPSINQVHSPSLPFSSFMTHHYTILRHTWDQQAVALEDNIYIFAGFTCDSVTIADPCTSAKYRWETYRIDQKLRIGWLNRYCWHILSPTSVTNFKMEQAPSKIKNESILVYVYSCQSKDNSSCWWR